MSPSSSAGRRGAWDLSADDAFCAPGAGHWDQGEGFQDAQELREPVDWGSSCRYVAYWVKRGNRLGEIEVVGSKNTESECKEKGMERMSAAALGVFDRGEE